ncbi:ABC transporter ATP-binding protein [Leekyejoonella antrihumi]|uniref:ABC transporter ATP-binding protein n=1 Tax=Leekyejoonella antrihumi TaxID=1660198 RepID=A0A563DUI7_9MICO|nr:ABC transporter ATP-binding protein [Leekyejoonella antrihumi]TWP33915.1 ABC transporter ATP-binding protein [Leekyejoonella antrihumi]
MSVVALSRTVEPLLSVQHLTIGIPSSGGGHATLVRDVSFEVGPGVRYGLVGESGSGKSMTLKAIAGLLPRGVEVLEGEIHFDGDDVLTMSPHERRRIMGPRMAMIFQEPMTALNPTTRVGKQIAEGPRRHLGLSKADAQELAVDMIRRTGIPDPARRARAYPHELSGGLRQRIMIAMALSCKPALVLCDEPTTALDVTVQDQVLRLLAQLCDDMGSALTFVTHDLAVVSQTCSRLSVMYAGRIMEEGNVREVYEAPQHPYTEALFQSAPDFDDPGRRLAPIPGLPPSLTDPPPGCPFAPRCQYAIESCSTGSKPLVEVRHRHLSACDLADQIFGGTR